MDRRERRFAGWSLVLVAALALGTAGVYQFGWSSIRLALGTRLDAPETSLGTVFTLFVVFQTISQFPAGWVRDRFGPRVPMLVGALGMAGGFAGVAFARTLPEAYVAYALGGIGVGVAYTVAVNTAVKWFTDRRGLATGVVTMAYSAGSFLLIPLIRSGIDDAFALTLLLLAAATGGTALLGAVVLRDPGVLNGDGPTADDEEAAYTWRETVRTWQFWLLYAVFVVVNGVGLMVIGKVVSYAAELSLPASAATASASLVALADAGGSVVLAGLSDRLGRRRTVAASLVLSGLALAGAVLAGEQGIAVGFVALVAATAFFRSPAFAIFPTIVGEYYGRAYSSENYAALYTAKLFGGVLGGTVASALVVSLGWSASFTLGAALIAGAGVAMMFLRPV
jgi:OFA family oxalate/formate antiporter-like MFS transporter